MTTSSWIERFYTHFIGRDMSYVFAGGLSISVVEYTLWGEIVFPQKLSIELVGFFLFSYFLGIAISEIGSYIGYCSKCIRLPKGYSQIVLLYQDLFEKFDDRIFNDLERNIFLLISGVSIGMSSFLSGFFMLVYTIYTFSVDETPTIENIFLAFCLIIFGIFMIMISKKQKLHLENILEGLVERISTSKEVNEKQGTEIKSKINYNLDG